VARRLLFLAAKHSAQGEEIMFRLSAWHILTAGLIGLSPACGSGAREDATSQGKRVASMPPSVAATTPELTSVKPVATPAPAPTPEAEVQPVVDKSKDELLDQLTFDAERKPGDVRLRIRLARALLDAGKVREARTAAERAVEVDEKSPGAWHVLGRVEMAERDFAAASTSFQRAVQEDPENSHAWNNLGYTLMEQSKFEEAAAALENATSGTSPAPYMWNNLGMAYEHLDRIREARAAYRQAASAGSARGQANLERLEGVTSLRPGAPAVTTGSTTWQMSPMIAPHDAIEEQVEQGDGHGSTGGAGPDEPQEEALGC
jgi:Flp pilus assembly protein TadD